MAVPEGMATRGPTRRDPMPLVWAAGLLFAGRIATGVWTAFSPVAEADYVAWHAIAGAEAESRKTGKPVLYDFTAEWCGPCGQLKREVFGDKAAAERINTKFIPVRVTDRQSEEGRNPPEVADLQKRYGIEAYPTLVIAPVGATPRFQRGYGGKESVMAWLESNSTRARPEKAGRKQSVKRPPK